jgi:hypothetical protein
MLFLRALHSHYSTIVEHFRTHGKSLETTSIDLIVDEVNHHDTFILKEPHHRDKSSKPPSRVLAAASAHTDNAGTAWNPPFDWLCESYGDKGIKTQWNRALGGNVICPICHWEEPKHVPKDCGLLKALHLKLINVAPAARSPALPPQSLTPATASPFPGGGVASSTTPPASGSTGSGTAPSGLTVVLAVTSEVPDDFESDDNFQ